MSTSDMTCCMISDTRATGPILEHLRDMDMTEHSLMHEVLKCESTGPPNLLNNSESYHLLKKSHMEKLDPSQSTVDLLLRRRCHHFNELLSVVIY